MFIWRHFNLSTSAGNAFWELERASAAKGNPNAPTGKKKTIMDDIVIDAYQEEVIDLSSKNIGQEF